MTSLQGKTLFITGASRGIGLAIALRAARDGANIAIAAKTAEPHPKLPGTIYTAAEEIEAAGGKALPLVCDIRYEEQVMRRGREDRRRIRRHRHLRQQCQRHRLTDVAGDRMKRFDLMHRINARGTFLVSKTCMPHLQEGGESARPDAVAAARHEAEMVRAHRLHHGQIRHEHVRARHGRRVPRAGSPSMRCGRAPPSPPPRSAISSAATP